MVGLRVAPALWLIVFAGILPLIGGALIDPSYAAKQSAAKKNEYPPLTLRQAVTIAVSRNLRMADARLAVEEKEYQRREAYSDFFPSVNLQYNATGYRYRQSGNVAALASAHDSRRIAAFLPPATFSDYPFRTDPYRAFSLTATMTQPVYSGGRLLYNYKYARLGVDYEELQLQVDRQDLILDVYDAYYQMMRSEKLLEVANDSVRALEALRNQTQEFYKAGVVAKVDVLSTEGQLANAKISQTQALTDIERYRAQMNLLLRYPPDTPITIVQDLEYRTNPYRIPAIYRLAAENRLEIRQANITVEQAMALVKTAQSSLIPSVTINGQASRFNDDWNPFDHEAVNDWSITGVFSWAFDAFRSRETVKERRASQARAFVAREQLVEDIMEEVKEAYLDMERSESDIFNNRKAVEFRRENFRINQERYKEQVATYTEVLDAQRELAQAEGDYYTSLIAYRLNRATLERLMGVLR